MGKIAKILKIEKITHDVKQFTVEKPKGYRFIPGQATEVSVNKRGFQNKKRPFTFTSLNKDPFLQFIIKAYPTNIYPKHTGVTEKIHQLKIQDELIIGDPWGSINYRSQGTFIAGGAGITPFIAIFKYLRDKGKVENNKLIFSNKEKKDIILESKLRSIFKPENLIFTLTREKIKNYVLGRIDINFLKSKIDNFSKPFYVCGPKIMVTEINGYLNKLGAKSEFIIFEK